MVVFSNSHPSSLNNPCPSGTGIGYGTFNETIFVICDSSFPHNPPVDVLGLSLGLGLGLGFPLIAFIVWAVVFWNNWWCYRNKYEVRRPLTIAEIRAAYSIDHEGATTPEEYVKLKLGPELFQDFMEGNLTVQLKKKLFAIHEQQGQILNDYIRYAEEINKTELAEWIINIKFTTLQDEGIV